MLATTDSGSFDGDNSLLEFQSETTYHSCSNNIITQLLTKVGSLFLASSDSDDRATNTDISLITTDTGLLTSNADIAFPTSNKSLQSNEKIGEDDDYNEIAQIALTTNETKDNFEKCTDSKLKHETPSSSIISDLSNESQSDMFTF